MPCTPAWATAAGARGWTAPWSRSTPRCRTARPWKSPPSRKAARDWLNAELGYLTSNRAKAKVRAWFNAQVTHETVARGREAVEKLLQREGKTAMKLDDLAVQLGFKSADALFEVSLRNIETLLRPPEPVLQPDDYLLLKKTRTNESAPKGGVLVVGIDSLMTQLAKCCKPAPPDDIRGFVTRGKGVSVHRADCSNFREMAARSSERVIEVEWGTPKSAAGAPVYPVDVAVEAADRQGLLRDISDPVGQGHGVDDLHRGSGRFRPPQQGARDCRERGGRALGAATLTGLAATWTDGCTDFSLPVKTGFFCCYNRFLESIRAYQLTIGTKPSRSTV